MIKKRRYGEIFWYKGCGFDSANIKEYQKYKDYQFSMSTGLAPDGDFSVKCRSLKAALRFIEKRKSLFTEEELHRIYYVLLLPDFNRNRFCHYYINPFGKVCLFKSDLL